LRKESIAITARWHYLAQMNNTTHTESSAVKAVGKTICDNLDSQNRQFLWNLFEDGSAMTREITRHSRNAGSAVETYREIHAAGSEMARLIALMMERQK
jgi:hypothetical protein